MKSVKMNHPRATGRRLKILRRERLNQTPEQKKYYWSLDEIGKRIKVSGATLSRLENGEFKSSKYLVPLAREYGVTLEFLIDGNTSEQKQQRLDRILYEIYEMNDMNLALIESVINQMKESKDSYEEG